METRQLLTFSATMAYQAATLTVVGARDAVVLTNVDGQLSHGALNAPAGESFADDFDFDSTLPGRQGLAASSSSQVKITGGDFDATFGSPTAPARTLRARIGLEGTANSSLTVDNSGAFSSDVEIAGSETSVGVAYGDSDGGGEFQYFNPTGFGGGVRVIGDSRPNTLQLTLEGGNPLPVGGLTYLGGGQGRVIVVGLNLGPAAVKSQVYALAASGNAEARFDDRRLTLSGVSKIDDPVRTSSATIDLSIPDPATVLVGGAGGTSLSVYSQVSVPGDTTGIPVYRFGNKATTTLKLGPGNTVVTTEPDSSIQSSTAFEVLGGGGDDQLVFNTNYVVDLLPAGSRSATFVRRGNGSFTARDFAAATLNGSRVLFQGNLTVNGVAGTPLSDVELAQFLAPSLGYEGPNQPDPKTGTDLFEATIYWGDGSISPGRIVEDRYLRYFSNYRVFGSLTYSQGFPLERGMDVTVVIRLHEDQTRDFSGLPVTINANSYSTRVTVAHVAVAPLNVTGSSIIATAGQSLSGVVVGSLTSTNPLIATGQVPLSVQSVRINWGDGTVDDGLLRPNGTSYDIVGNHTYATYGSFAVSATVVTQENSVNQTVTARSVANVSDAPIAATPKLDSDGTPTGPAGSRFNAAVWSFGSANSQVNPPDYQATIDWGDGTTSEGYVFRNVAGVLVVGGNHIYARPGSYQTLATISGRRPGGSTASADAVLDARGSTLTTTSMSPVVAVRAQPFSGVLTTFTSSNPLASADQFVVSIDWADGTAPSAGVVNQRADGTFEVSGSHTYATPSGFPVGPPGSPVVDGLPPSPVVVTVRELGGGSTLASESPRTVFDAPLTAQGTTVTGVAGSPLRQTVLANFQYAISLNQSPNLYAFVNWGDGTSETLTGYPVYFIGTSGGYGLGQVAAGHTYAAAGTYAISVSITSSFGSGVVVSSQAVVEPAPAPITVAGGLSPASDTGVSNSDGITRDNRPVFTGVATAWAAISLFSRPAGSGATPTLIGQATAGADGAWSITSTTLADGAYTILAVAALPGAEGVVTQILPDATRGFLVIDTVGPRVTGSRFLPFTGRVETTFQDDRSGLAQATLTNPANFGFRRVGDVPGQGSSRGPARSVVNGVSTTANLDPTAAQLVLVTLNNNRTIADGVYRSTVLSGGVTDVAGNPLAGSFSGSLPTTGPAGDFAADLVNVRRRALPPLAVGSVGDSLTLAGKRQLAKILTAFGNGRTSGTQAADQIARLPRRVTASVAVATPSGGLAAKLRGGKARSSR